MARRFTKYPSRSIKASKSAVTASMPIPYHVIRAYLSDNSVYSTLNQFEKKIIAKAANSIDYQVYLCGAIEALDLAGVSVSPTFEKVAEMLIENWDFDDQDRVAGRKPFSEV